MNQKLNWGKKKKEGYEARIIFLQNHGELKSELNQSTELRFISIISKENFCGGLFFFHKLQLLFCQY